MIIFLQLDPRQTGGEVLPQSPFRAFVKFKTAYVDGGGLAVLPLQQNGRQIGTAVIGWPATESRARPRGGKYLVGSGSLDEIDAPAWVIDEVGNRLVFDAMTAAGWTFLPDPFRSSTKNPETLFERWILANLE